MHIPIDEFAMALSVGVLQAAATDDAAATLSVSAAHSQDSQAGSRGGEVGSSHCF